MAVPLDTDGEAPAQAELAEVDASQFRREILVDLVADAEAKARIGSARFEVGSTTVRPPEPKKSLRFWSGSP